MRNLLTIMLLATHATFLITPIRANESVPIGKPVGEFRLPDVVTEKDVRLGDFKGKVVVIIFYSHTCTFCRNYEARFRQLAANYAGKGVALLAVDSTGRTGKEAASAWREKRMGFPLLLDDRARTAAALGAMAMTTVCIVDGGGVLRYFGAFDDSEFGTDIRSRFVADAVAALVTGKRVALEQTEVYGCLIPLPR